MKKVVFGGFVFLAGLVSTALLLAASVSLDWTINDKHSAVWNLNQFGMMPVLYLFAGIAALGLILALWGLLDKTR